MHRRFIVSDPDKCVGCRICGLVCSLIKEKGFNPLLSRIRSIRMEPTFNISIACCLCEDPTCVKSCPKSALSKNMETGIIQVDEDKCNGCAWCIESCEFGTIILHPTKKIAAICDLCVGDPKCIQYCPTGALMFVSTEEISQKTREKLVKIFAEKL